MLSSSILGYTGDREQESGKFNFSRSRGLQYKIGRYTMKQVYFEVSSRIVIIIIIIISSSNYMTLNFFITHQNQMYSVSTTIAETKNFHP